MSPRSEILKQIVGKTITGIVLHESEGPGPRYQLFMIFNDNTYLEFYGDMSWTNRLETVKQYASWFGGKVVVIN
jgi:hypothetical protein